MISPEFLSKIPIFEGLLPVDLEVIQGLWHPKNLSEGEVLFRKGDKGSSMFIIEEGSIEITIPIPNQKREERISVLHEAEFLGELSMVDGLPRTASARALEPCRLLEMKREDFIRFLMERPAVSISMVSEIGKRLRETNELVQNLASKNVNVEIEEQLKFGDRIADKVAEFGGSWAFIFTFLGLMTVWMGLNTVQLWYRPFDEYPFILLNLMLSTVAALQGPVIMMSQNRAQMKDRLKADLDYQVNLKSELMLQELHAKLDELRATELHEIHSAVKGELEMLKERLEEQERLSALKSTAKQ
jgi:CRP/FNR family cyclic AMP-dependent transcriptional regulator